MREGLAKQTRYYHRERAKIIRALGGLCEDCGTSFNLEIAHDGKGNYPFTCSNKRPFALRRRDWIEQLKAGNLHLVCQDCHVKRDFGR